MKVPLFLALIMVPCSTATIIAGTRPPVDRALRARLVAAGVSPLVPGPLPPRAKVRLGQMLFFDKVLGGNRDIACATCHHPAFMTGDALSLSIGTTGIGLGPDRVKEPSRAFVPRNATEIFNRGSPDWTTMFWDFRVSNQDGQFRTPAGDQLPDGLDSVLAAQAMFPVTGRDEMRGLPGDQGNELAMLADQDFSGIWSALMERLLSYPAYRRLFSEAYPSVPARSLGFQHAANAIAAFEAAAFTLPGSPWDRYVAGDDHALDGAAKQGGLLFYGRAGCFQCHSGSLFTDQRAHNIAIPQFGPGKPPAQPLDFGCGVVTGRESDRFTFRTPPLRNVAMTGPWMHNGAYTSLEAAVRHHLSPAHALLSYDRSQLPATLQPTVQDDPATLQSILATLDPRVQQPLALSEGDIHHLISFLHALTSPAIGDLEGIIPDEVPSGLPVDRIRSRFPGSYR